MYSNYHYKRSNSMNQTNRRPFKQQRAEWFQAPQNDCGEGQSGFNSEFNKFQNFQKPRPQLVAEKDVGITEYVNNLPGFSAIVKARYSDFLVNEVGLDGSIARLTHFDEPIEENKEDEVQMDAISEENLKLIEELQEGLRKQVFINVSNDDKDKRRAIHDYIRKKFTGLNSKTESYADEKYIVIERLCDLMKAQKMVETRQNYEAKRGRRGKLPQKKVNIYPCERRFHPHGRGDYTQFVLYKENRDTMEAVNFIASRTRMPLKYFSYAGTKDKRGKTVQNVTAYHVPAAELLALNNIGAFVKIGNVEYTNTALKLGDLSGNHFVMILRQLEGDLSRIDECISSFATSGFINYYGLQRFGTRAVPTHQIGRALILGQWREAINLILTPVTGTSEGDYEDDLTKACRLYINTGDARTAFRRLTKRSRFSLEGRLLMGLQVSRDNDYVGALNRIPRNTRLMYLHSYQSYIWNKVASRRIREFGLQPKVGDLCFTGSVDSSEFVDDLQPVSNTEKTQVSTEANEDTPDIQDESKDEECELNKSLDPVSCEDPTATETNVSEEQKDSDELLKLKVEPEILDEDQIGNRSIFDIVLPLPGRCVKYPDNEIKTWYEEYLKEDGLDLNSFTSKVKAYSLGGAYRKLIVKPENAKYEILCYTDPTLPLVLSDYDITQKQELPPPIAPAEDVKKALKLEFTLPSSSYATMAIREILKTDHVCSNDF